MRIVAFGDSITFGQFIDREQCWTTVLAELTGARVINRGVCGDTTRNGLGRFPRDVQDFEPDVALIQFGFNDCNRWETDQGLPRVSLGSFKANLAEMEQRARHFGIRPVFQPMFEPDRQELREWAWPYAEALTPFLSDRTHAFPKLELLDGLHLNENGHRVYAETVAQWLG